MSKIKSIKDLIADESIFNNDRIPIDNISGLSIGYLMEQVKIPDLTSSDYDPSSKKLFAQYAVEINDVIRKQKMEHFFNKIPEHNRTYVKSEFLPTIKAGLSAPPKKLYHAFAPIIAKEQDRGKKAELQLMDIVMLSRLPSYSKKHIVDRLIKIRTDQIPERLKPIYELAHDYFI